MKSCSVCGWQRATRKGRCNACRLFLRRHGRDKTLQEVRRGWERCMDRAISISAELARR